MLGDGEEAVVTDFESSKETGPNGSSLKDRLNKNGCSYLLSLVVALRNAQANYTQRLILTKIYQYLKSAKGNELDQVMPMRASR